MKKLNSKVVILSILVSFHCFAAATKQSDEYYMQMALDLAKNNPKAPFAAVIVDNSTGEVLAKGLNASKINPTFHGEMVAINHCIKEHPDVNWSRTTLYTTAEPCSMCQSAVVWAKIPKVVFALSNRLARERGQIEVKLKNLCSIQN